MRRVVSFIFCFLTCFNAKAQFNDSITQHVRFSASGNLNQSNNATAYLLTNDARYSIRNKRTTLNTAATWLYGQVGDRLTNNDFTSTTDFNLYRDSSQLYYWALANFTTSFSLRIRNQIQGGVGAAYNFVNTPTAWLNLSEGILYEASHLATADPAKNQYQTFRNSLRLAYKFVIKNALTFNGTNFWQPAIGNGSDYTIRTSNSIGVKLNMWISIGTTLSYNRFNRTGAENLLFTYGLVAEKYF
ncbi:MAG TPA: DUF481 domain-containing protein [Flavisolibacter sp.]|jgi:hypothetical protein|nr:DUF481 domain-containing protein [Flavisolibacter sp.]